MIAGAEHCGPGGCKLRIAGVSKVFDGRRGKVVALEGIKLIADMDERKWYIKKSAEISKFKSAPSHFQ